MKTTVKYNRDVIGRFDVTGSKRDCAGISRFQLWVYKVKQVTRHTTIVLALLFLGIWAMYGLMQFMPVEVKAMPVPVYVTATTTAPVMLRIARCESGNAHYGKDGQVIIHVNNDKSYDIGKYQINSVHNSAAHKMGLDLTKESDNEKYAQFLYSTEGTGDWYSSRACWQ